MKMTYSSAFMVSLAMTSLSIGAEAPKVLDFKISSATNPGGQGGYTGTVHMERAKTTAPFKVTWKLSDGTTQKGWGVPFPDSGYIAVAYGEATGVALYLQTETGADAVWSPTGDGQTIGTYKLKKTDDPLALKFDDGGTFTLAPGKSPTAQITWKLPTGTYKGPAVIDEKYLAAASSPTGKNVGVVIYKAEGAGAKGIWTMTGMEGAGTENLEVVTIDGKPVSAEDLAAAAEDPSKEVKALAAELRGNAKKLQELKPTAEQIAQIAATKEDAALLSKYVDTVFESLPADGLPSKPDQTVILFTGPKDLPGGYASNASHFKKGLAIYGFEYVAPGTTAGMAFDGLVKLDGKWVMIPKMWRAFK